MILFTPNMMPFVWPIAEPFLVDALPHGAGEYSIEDLRAGCFEGRYQLWKAMRGASHAWVVTTVVQFPSARLLYILALGGTGLEIKMYAEGWDTLSKYAKQCGCSAIEAFGRRGWRRSGTLPAKAIHKADVIYLEV